MNLYSFYIKTRGNRLRNKNKNFIKFQQVAYNNPYKNALYDGKRGYQMLDRHSYEVKYNEEFAATLLETKAESTFEPDILHLWARDSFFTPGSGLFSFVRNFLKAGGEYTINGKDKVAVFGELLVEEIQPVSSEEALEDFRERLKEKLVVELDCNDETANLIIEGHSQTPSIFINDLMRDWLSSAELLQRQPKQVNYDLTWDKESESVNLKCTSGGFALANSADPEDTLYYIPDSAETLFKLTSNPQGGKPGYTLVSAATSALPLANALNSEPFTKSTLSPYQLSPLANYLHRPDVQKKIKLDVTSPQHISHCFDDLPLYKAVDAPLLATLLTANQHDQLDAWKTLAYSMAAHDLFDKKGDLRKDVYDALNSQGALDAIVISLETTQSTEDVENHIKSQLFSAYLNGLVNGAISKSRQLRDKDIHLEFDEVRVIDAHAIRYLDENLLALVESNDAKQPKELKRALGTFASEQLGVEIAMVEEGEDKERKDKGKGKRHENERSDEESGSDIESDAAPFTQYLKSNKKVLDENTRQHLLQGAQDGNNEGLISRSFNDLHRSSNSDYSGIQSLTNS